MDKKWKISKDTVAFVFSFHAWGTERTGDLKKFIAAKEAMKEMTAEEKDFTLSKQLLTSPQHAAIKKYAINVAKQWVEGNAVPSFFKKGCYLFRLEQVERVVEKMEDAQREVERLVEEFLAVYEDQKQAAKMILSKTGQYKESEYPSIEEMRSLFWIEWSWVKFQVPDELPDRVKIAEMQKAKDMWSDAAESITFALREAFKGLIAHAVDKLTPTDDGKMKIFRDTTIENIRDFLATFNDRNVTGDAELAELVEKAEKVMLGVSDAKSLRDNEAVRMIVREEFKEIEAQVDGLVIEKRRVGRKLNMDV